MQRSFPRGSCISEAPTHLSALYLQGRILGASGPGHPHPINFLDPPEFPSSPEDIFHFLRAIRNKTSFFCYFLQRLCLGFSTRFERSGDFIWGLADWKYNVTFTNKSSRFQNKLSKNLQDKQTCLKSVSKRFVLPWRIKLAGR